MGRRTLSRVITGAAATGLVAGLAVAMPATRALAATPNRLIFDMATVSAKNVSAVGLQFNGTAQNTLTEHWNGTSWRVVSSPNVTGTAQTNILTGVDGASATSTCAVGSYRDQVRMMDLNLVMRWNGTSWRRQI